MWWHVMWVCLIECMSLHYISFLHCLGSLAGIIFWGEAGGHLQQILTPHDLHFQTVVLVFLFGCFRTNCGLLRCNSICNYLSACQDLFSSFNFVINVSFRSDRTLWLNNRYAVWRHRWQGLSLIVFYGILLSNVCTPHSHKESVGSGKLILFVCASVCGCENLVVSKEHIARACQRS